MSVCVLFFFFHREMGSLVSSHSHMKQREVAHTHARNPYNLLPLSVFLLSVCLSLLHYCTDFRLLSKLINKREVADSHVLANWRGRKGVFIFWERQNVEVLQVSESLSDSWMPACRSSSHDTVFATGVVFVWVLLPVPEHCHFTRSFRVSGKLRLGYTKLKAVWQHCQGPWRSC